MKKVLNFIPQLSWILKGKNDEIFALFTFQWLMIRIFTVFETFVWFWFTNKIYRLNALCCKDFLITLTIFIHKVFPKNLLWLKEPLSLPTTCDYCNF